MKEMEGAKRRFLGNRHCEADELANNDQQGTAINKNILVEEREFMRIERKLKKIGPQGGRGWRTTGTTEDNLVMSDDL